MSQQTNRLARILSWILYFSSTWTAEIAAVEIGFSGLNTVESSFDGAWNVGAADLDGDGDLDLFGSAQFDDDVAWWENTAGDASAWTRHDLTLDFDLAREVAAGDLDGDGDLDLVGGAFLEDEIRWWENDLDSGAACGMDFCEHILDANANGANSVALADFDRDGDLDVVGMLRAADQVVWYENSGDASAWTEHLIDGAFDGAQAVAVADLDGDGDADILGGTGEGSGELSWFENDLAGDGPCVPDWCEHSLDTGTTSGLAIADLDGDGDLDFVRNRGTAGLGWWENAAGDGSTWIENGSPIAASSFGAVHALDLDMDDDVDVLPGGDVIFGWYENAAGDGSAWTERGLGPADALTEIQAADLDGDGDVDLVGASTDDDFIGWWENQTLHRTAVFPVEETITISPEFVPWHARAADIDGDGDADMVGSSGAGFAWIENSPSGARGPSWTRHLLAPGLGVEVGAADIDGDGDLDVVGATSTGSQSVRWWENDGSACDPDCSWPEYFIEDGFAGWALALADVDGDGDVDVAATTLTFGGGLVLWQNLGCDPTCTWSRQTVDGSFFRGKAVEASDVDGDGDLDLLAVSDAPGEVAWWENLGCDPTCAWSKHTIDGAFPAADGVLAVDMDRDGDIDVLGSSNSFSDGEIAWWENLGCDPACSWSKHSVDPDVTFVSSIFASDVDADGDVDVLSTSTSTSNMNGLRWWENDGSACDPDCAWPQRVVAEDTGLVRSISAADVDGDGDPDLVAQSPGGGGLAWWANRGGQFALPTADAVTAATPNEGATDVLALKIDGEHRGLAGEAAAELATVQLLFEEAPGDPLTNPEFSDLIDAPRFYLDDGDGAFEPGADDLELGLGGPLFANDGLVSATLINGDPSVEIAFGTPVSWWVALDLEPGAGTAVAGSFTVTHLTESTSTGEVAGTAIPLALEHSANVASSPIAVNGAPVVATPIGDRSYGVGGAVSFDLSFAFDDPDLDALTFSATGLPAALTLSTAGVLTGTPTAGDLGGSPYTVTVTAADSGGLETEDTFELEIRVAEIFADSFESGDTSAWSVTTTP